MARAPRPSSPDALQHIHAAASHSDTLTTFDDLTSPPPSSCVGDVKGIELVHGGLSGLYSRLRASVGGTKDSGDGSDEILSRSSKNKLPLRTSQTPRSPADTAVSSPVMISVPSSRLQSPLVSNFPEHPLPSSRGSNVSSPAVSSKASITSSKTPVATTKSRPSIPTNAEVGNTSREDNDSLYRPRSGHSGITSASNLGSSAKDNASGAMSSSSGLNDSPRYSARFDEPFRQQRGDIDLREQESDTTEDDLVMVEGGGFPETTPNLPFPLEFRSKDSRTSEHISAEPRFQASLVTREPKDLLDNGSEMREKPRIVAGGQTTVSAPIPQRPPLVQVGPSHLPGFRPSRASSSDGLSSVVTATTIRSPDIPSIDEVPPNATAKNPVTGLPSNALPQMRRKVLSREFWMRDENAKDCFNCGDAFSTFRRKHHCRTCGQIFDAKCTSLVSGKMFGQSGNLRVCKPCEAIIYGHDDDSSVYTDDGEQASLYEPEGTARETEESSQEPFDPSESDHTKIGTPTISIPMSRKAGSEKKRRSAVIELGAPQILARPSSSRSLRSLSGRPRSSSHKRHHSRHQHMRNVRYDDRAPFHQHVLESARNRSNLPAFHHDNIIDPDLAPFMSDKDSSEDEHASILATLHGDSPTHASGESEKGGFGSLLAALRKTKSRSERSAVSGGNARDTDNASMTGRQMNRHSRRRNLSVSSIAHGRPSPKRTKSNSLLRTIGAGLTGGVPNVLAATPLSQNHPLPMGASRITRSASMQGGNAPVVELNQASLQHVRKLLKQLLQDSSIPHASSWEKALMPILLQCTDDVNPDVQRNDDIDIRHYIKLKKIPGGRPIDTSYVSGVVFTKKVALKSMCRSISNPRIIIVTFPIEYARHQQHFMSLEPVIAQEREYLLNLVNRIAALQPHVLLVQRNVSGLALEFLEQAGIAVAYNVKATVLNAVARCTQSRMISSVDKLAIDPIHLGKCESFDVKTYVHHGSKKTYIYLSGCQKDLGCTIVLRGADTETLRRLKRITEFMCYVVYNLKLETCLMRDEFVLIPSVSSGGTLASNKQEAKTDSCQHSGKGDNQILSCMPKGVDAFASNNEHHAQGPEEIHVPDDAPTPSFYSEMVEKHNTKILSASPFVRFMQPYLLMQAREQERKLGYLKNLRDRYSTDEEKSSEESRQKFELVQPEMVHTMVEQASKQVRDFLHAVHAAEYDKALHNYQTQKRQWEAYLAGNMNLYDPFNHQKIAVLYSVVNSVTSTPCIGPEIIALGFYHEHDYDDGFTPDCTLGQYVEDLCHTAGTVCDVDGCNRRMFDHHRQYVHGEGQMSVIVQKYPSKIKGLQNTILMWSCCRMCREETQVIPMSENTWKYSFAKYLELTFWSSELHPRADVCPHDIHKNHVRYFGFNNVALRIQFDAVQLYEVTVPRPTVAWKVDSDLKIKNEQFLKIEERLDRFMASVRERLRSINAENVVAEKIEVCKTEVEKLMKRANEEHDWLRRKLQDKYMSSRYYEIIPLNRAIRAIQEKAIAWDETFAEIEHQFFPSEKDIRRLATLQLKKLFLERDESTSSLTSVDEGSESAEDETPTALTEKGDPLALTPMPSSMSVEQARDMLTLVVKQDSSQGAEQSELGPTPSKEQQFTDPFSNANHEFPIQTPIEALDREDVRHLDLAVPSNFPDSNGRDEHELNSPTASPELRLSPLNTSLGPGGPASINPTDQTVAEGATDVPTSSQPLQSRSSTLESKIPRLVDTIRRETGSRPSTLIRTQSQPGGISKRGSLPTASSSGAKASSAASRTESPKMNLSDSSRALERRMSERLGLGAFRQAKSSSMIPRSVPQNKQRDTRVSTLARHFEQLSREFEKERIRERRQMVERSRQVRAYPLASSKPIVEVYRDVHEAVQEHSPSDEDLQPSSPRRASTDTGTLDDSILTETTGPTSSPPSPPEEEGKDLVLKPSGSEGRLSSDSHPASDLEIGQSDTESTAIEELGSPGSIDSSQILSNESQLESSLELPKHEKNTLMKMLTSFWSERSASGWAPLDYPFAQNEHVWEDSDIIVREDEPSSIIALALSSPDYMSKLQNFRADQGTNEKTTGDLTASEASIERNLLHQANTNIRYGFTNRGIKAQCKIFYAQSFDALRRKCGVADRFVESLSRCSKWDSKGGKSKSIFLKTLDDRFVLKSLSPIEVNAFLRFAPNYFAFTHQNLFKGLPSVIAKMFGLFQVQIKTPTGRDFDWYMLVMENLFYDRNPNRRYDLKGSMRNRKIESTGERDEVLLDENLVDIIYSETPIFVREHTKKLLKASVWNDTLFLSQQNVMDYSLMAGFDDTRREIIVGIIDCIRTYTWDKKLESWIKDRGKNKPTITSPKDYRNRFRIAMEKYILQAPNCWHQFNPKVGMIKQMRLDSRNEKRQIEAGASQGDSELNSPGGRI
ncbi:hypothetical protein GQ43DRAFT_483976 [Delitschia confertaspora ATCC 74209]|uniref:1-phosphatidylinositol-3-phosphate 5-kinase n=1 Tax=Delitschia confertaspora ATCC 74209 TaxID=1513339 RepID=A0A9P4JJ51_9PLEO|nr:hypothetical protein GQ43DRAFT_483976 [Delitschia confertaspora ATCC 74209]